MTSTRSAVLHAAEAFFGAVPSQDGVRFRIWAPDAQALELVIHSGGADGAHPLARRDDGLYETWIKGAGAGDRYSYRLDGGTLLPDPASRFQPEGVHGPSAVVDPRAFRWTDTSWRIRPLRDLILYELHVGTFTTEGTFAGVQSRLPYLRDLGVTAIEMMPIADFAGSRNWGYDGVALFAPSRAYGTPDDLRRLVDAAHAQGLAVMLDVVYNHLGPEGAYVTRFFRDYMAETQETPWGKAVNVDHAGAADVRRFLIDNARHWIREYHLDGLRLDATHALIDAGSPHIVEELARDLRRAAGRDILLHAEDNRNLSRIVEPLAMHGWGLDGVWADDFHHVIRRMIAGDEQGYYADYAGTAAELATVLRQGWLYTGAHSAHLQRPRGTDPAHVPMDRFVVCLQNHDQIGNRALGDRLHQQIAAESWRAASVLLLTAPMTPLLFMGQEWAASTPFQYFTDLEPTLGSRVTQGRRNEFAAFPEYSSEDARERIPDPQAKSTFERSRLAWDERSQDDHRRSLALYRALLALRRDHQALAGSDAARAEAVALDQQSVVLRRSDDRETFWVVASLRTSAEVDLVSAAATLGADLRDTTLELVLDTEHGEYTADPLAIDMARPSTDTTVRFQRAGAVILRQR